MKSALAVATIAAVGASAETLSQAQAETLFTNYVSQFNKKYETKNFFNKFGVFQNNVNHILTHNANPDKSFVMGINQFTDMTPQEFEQTLTMRFGEDDGTDPKAPSKDGKCMKCRDRSIMANCTANYNSNDANLIDRLFKIPEDPIKMTIQRDLQSEGHVKNVPDQGRCGSCWSFSSTGTMEVAMSLLKPDEPYHKLSEQELVECTRTEVYKNGGCRGGLMVVSFRYVGDRGGKLSKNSAYPYLANDDNAHLCPKKREEAQSSRDQYINFDKVEYNAYDYTIDETKLYTMGLKGPVAIALDASGDFQFYRSGILRQSTNKLGCSPNHALVLVGVKRDNITPENSSGIPYYRIRNSWGATWGDNGYVNLEYGTNAAAIVGHPWTASIRFRDFA